MTGERGIDVSHHQGPIDWPKVAGAGIRFAWAKCTEAAGTYLYVDSQYATNRAGARAAGIIFGAYHFGRPASDPALSAQQFREHAGWAPGDLPLVLDLETDDGYTPANCMAWAKAFFAALDRPGMVYTGHWFWSSRVTAAPDPVFSAMPLWLGPDRPQPPCWAEHTIAQTYGAAIPGVAGACDLDTITVGSLADLTAYAAGQKVAGPTANPASTTQKELWDMADYLIIFVTYQNAIYEASLLTQTYYRVPDPDALKARQIALDNAGIPYKKNGGTVTGLDRYGIELKRRLI